MNHIEIKLNKTLNTQQIYNATKFLFNLGVSVYRAFNPNGKAQYVIKFKSVIVNADSIEQCIRKFVEKISEPNFTMLSNNQKRKLIGMLR